MRPLVIDSAAEQRINALVAHATKNPLTVLELKEIIAGKRPAPGDDSANVITLDFGFKVVFTLEDHPQKKRLPLRMRHLSVSVDRVGALPNMAVMAELLKRFGFSGKFSNHRVWTEDVPGGTKALNVVEPAIDGGVN